MSAPPGYPLPWCEAISASYCSLNLKLCVESGEWRAWQSARSMAEIYAAIDDEIAAGRLQRIDLMLDGALALNELERESEERFDDAHCSAASDRTGRSALARATGAET